MVPEIISSKWRERICCVTNETSRGVSIHTQEKGDEEMVSVPERLERLLADFGMGCSIHEQHAKEHNMPSNTTRLCVVDLNGCFWSDLSLLNIEEAAKVSTPLNSSPNSTYLT